MKITVFVQVSITDFHGIPHSRIPGIDENIRLCIEPYPPLKPTKVGFIFFGPNSLSRAEDLAAVNHMTQAVVRIGSKIGS